MGGNFSSANNVFVYTDRPFYHGGDVVNGHVLLNCTQPFQCQRILLKVEGYEKVSWEEKREDKKYDSDKSEWITTESTTPYSAESSFFKCEVPLHTWPHTCQPGQYQFPFAFVLPLGMPGSFEHLDSNNNYAGRIYNYTKAKVKYRVKAECVMPGLTLNLRHKAYLTVHQQLDKPPSEFRASHCQEVKKCCCFGQGTVNVIANVQKDSYAPGETACILLQVENNSSAEFSTIKLKLHRKVKLSAGGGFQEIEAALGEQSFPGVQEGACFMGSDAKSMQIALPADLRPTTHGHLVECKYKLVVKLKASAFTSDVELKVPILIYYPAAPQFQAYSQPPAWWQPTVVAPPVQLVLPSAPPMPPKAQQMDAYVPPQPTFSGPTQ